jgi:hypothetical protein
MRFRYIQYDFQFPLQLTEVDYNHLKKMVTINPRLKLIEKNSFYNKFKPWVLIVGLSIVITIILAILWSILWESAAGRILNTLLTISGFVFIASSIMLFWFLGGASYLWYIFEKNQFYRRMKRELLQAKSYEAFLRNFYYDYGYFYRQDE